MSAYRRPSSSRPGRPDRSDQLTITQSIQPLSLSLSLAHIYRVCFCYRVCFFWLDFSRLADVLLFGSIKKRVPFRCMFFFCGGKTNWIHCVVELDVRWILRRKLDSFRGRRKQLSKPFFCGFFFYFSNRPHTHTHTHTTPLEGRGWGV